MSTIHGESSSPSLAGRSVVHWGRGQIGLLLDAIPASSTIAVTPLCNGGTCRGVALALAGGDSHLVDFHLVPSAKKQVLAAVASHTRAVVASEADAGALTIAAPNVLSLELTAHILDGGRCEASEFSLARLAQNAWGISLPPLEMPPDNTPIRPPFFEASARHVRAVVQLDQHMEAQAEAMHLQAIVELEQRVAPIVRGMERKGILVDPTWGAMVELRQQQVTSLERQLGEELQIAHVTDAALLQSLRRQGLDVHGTGREALAPYLDYPVLSKILEWHRCLAFVQDLGRAVNMALERSPDGRVRPRWHQLGCATGRMSCSSPNLLGVPREPEVRSKFIAAPGYVFVVADYSTVELRVLAEITKDQRLIEVFARGGDPHLITAAALSDKAEDEVTADERKAAKAINFGLAYAMGADTLRSHALVHYGVKLTHEEAERARRIYRQTYPGIAAWQDHMRREMPRETRTLGGRVRYFADRASDYNARLASPVQGTVADALKKAMLLMAPRLALLDAATVLAVHDELVIEVPERAAEEVEAIVKDTMASAMERYVTSVPIEVKTNCRLSWAAEAQAMRLPVTPEGGV